jgi:quinoprotein glucose dehydrogenase
MRIITIVFLALVISLRAVGQETEAPPPPAGARKVMPASDEAETTIKSFKVPAGFKVELFAAEPHVANISAFDIGPDSKVYVVEVFRRRGGGVLDMRNMSAAWLDDDLASRSVADRVALVKRRMTPAEQRAMQLESDRVRLVEDRDGDGRADHATVFADGFNQLEAGTAAGVMPFNGSVYFANIPNLWLLRDENGDGRADARTVLHTGFGVHYEISGHDLHGLRVGPDGRVYFSIGDRALHVTGPDGKTIVSNPDSGAVLRCEPDGSNLELVHTGLRNPQDLAFDEYGNLFTGDNNSDGGDASRWVYVVEGGDSGWRTGYQWHDFPVSRGPWNNERLWDVKSDVPAAYVLPPIANPPIAGPSGLTYTGGVGLPPEWRGRFLLVDFRGGPANSGVWALRNKAKGASFELAETKQFLRGALATDVECGYDGGVYFSDWVNGWVPMGKGRIYRVVNPQALADTDAGQLRTILDGLSHGSREETAALLSHPDYRVRTAAHNQLAEQGAKNLLSRMAGEQHGPLGRLHAIWGLWQLGRRHDPTIFWQCILPRLSDSDPEVRVQAARALADASDRRADVSRALAERVRTDRSDRVKFTAALSLARLRGAAVVPAVVEMIAANDDRDPYLRHAGVVALAGCADGPTLLRLAEAFQPSVRMAAGLALRRTGRPQVARLLDDPDPRIVLEAARAINDEPIDFATEALAALATKTGGIGEGKVRELIQARALNANFRLGTAASAAAVARFAQRDDVPDVLRVEALHMLRDWGKASTRDRVTGVYHPRSERDAAVANDAIRPLLPAILKSAPDKVRVAAAGLVQTVGLSDTAVLLDLVNNARFSGEARAAGLAALAQQKAPQLAQAVDTALKEKDRTLRRAAILASAVLPDGGARLRKLIDSGSPRDQQAAFEAAVRLPAVDANAILSDAMDRLLAGKVAPEARLDLVAAAGDRPALADKVANYRASFPKDDALAPYRDTLAGGDVARGKLIFQERADVQCLRCHAKGDGGTAGPDLAGIGRKQSREYLLESILFPAKHIARGWETVTVRVKNGDTFAGVLKSEDDRQLVLLDPEKGELRLDKAQVTARRGGQTAMPSDIAQPLTKHDLRDLVEFLAELR